ncbi:DNA repair protein RecN [Capillimicrobium parvum]|uniref:DNA repair protein RecN n=1 Tax=Capillimicrobium parvum TaxID=2884022 RepID=A0A9E6XZE0_9ACTN|nr:DNA repair protein RecN [Capillimicrobium parvum]UGS37105.1 DNA repair protein RecN [Capillimicrobium parvum]
MLNELRVENLLLIERAELRLAPGLNVLTGETGAGKTVLAHALDLLLGGKARAGIVRPGAAEAYVEGVFELPGELRGELGERLPEDADEVVLARRVGANGRTRAYVNGRSANAGDLRELAEPLIAFYGQHEHRRLTLSSTQLDVLDGYCGAAQLERRAAAAAAHGRARSLQAALDELRDRAGARERELDLLEFELAEIAEVSPDEDEERDLLAARDRLRHMAALGGAAMTGVEAIEPGDGEGGAASLLAAAGAALEGVAGIDPELDGLVERFRVVTVEVGDLASELRRYVEDLDAEPGRLDMVEARLAAVDRLKRKHGGSVAAVLEHAESCTRRRDELVGAEEALGRAEDRLAQARAELAALSAELHEARAAAGPALAESVRERLAALAMEGASFEVALADREPGPAGADAVEFLIAANPGVPAGPLRDIASGGELSRVMLALMGVANEEGGATLVFDEVDAGIGGVTARAVGEQLRTLARSRQVICITHLPQVASLADRNFSIAKDTSADPARTTVTELASGELVGELVRMLGADGEDAAARRHAEELLRAA